MTPKKTGAKDSRATSKPKKKKETKAQIAAAAKKLKGQTFTDYLERTLLVTEVVPGDPGGREVRGEITYNPTGRTGKSRTDAYSCTLKSFKYIWKDKVPPATVEQMAVNEKEAAKRAKG